MFEYAKNKYEHIPRNSFYIFWKQGNLLYFYKTCCIPVFFSTKCNLFNNFVFFCPHNTFFINYALKFKYPPQQDKD